MEFDLSSILGGSATRLISADSFSHFSVVENVEDSFSEMFPGGKIPLGSDDALRQLGGATSTDKSASSSSSSGESLSISTAWLTESSDSSDHSGGDMSLRPQSPVAVTAAFSLPPPSAYSFGVGKKKVEEGGGGASGKVGEQSTAGYFQLPSKAKRGRSDGSTGSAAFGYFMALDYDAADAFESPLSPARGVVPAPSSSSSSSASSSSSTLPPTDATSQKARMVALAAEAAAAAAAAAMASSNSVASFPSSPAALVFSAQVQGGGGVAASPSSSSFSSSSSSSAASRAPVRSVRPRFDPSVESESPSSRSNVAAAAAGAGGARRGSARQLSVSRREQQQNRAASSSSKPRYSAAAGASDAGLASNGSAFSSSSAAGISSTATTSAGVSDAHDPHWLVVLPLSIASSLLKKKGRIPYEVAYRYSSSASTATSSSSSSSSSPVAAVPSLYPAGTRTVGVYSLPQRAVRMTAWNNLRARRIFYKKVKYRQRRMLAHGRQRIKGRFVKDAPLPEGAQAHAEAADAVEEAVAAAAEEEEAFEDEEEEEEENE